MDEKLCLWLEDFDNEDLPSLFEQEEVWREQIQIFNEENNTEYRFSTALRIYKEWKRKKMYEG